MIAEGLAAACAAFALGASVFHLRSVLLVTHWDARLLGEAVGARVAPSDLRQLSAELRGESCLVAELVGAVTEASSAGDAQREANLVLLELEHRLPAHDGVSRTLVRIAAYGGLLGVLALLSTPPVRWGSVLDVVGMAAGAVVVAVVVGRETERWARAQRRAVDTLVDRLLAAVQDASAPRVQRCGSTLREPGG